MPQPKKKTSPAAPEKKPEPNKTLELVRRRVF
jgi:hypothetical protein